MPPGAQSPRHSIPGSWTPSRKNSTGRSRRSASPSRHPGHLRPPEAPGRDAVHPVTDEATRTGRGGYRFNHQSHTTAARPGDHRRDDTPARGARKPGSCPDRFPPRCLHPARSEGPNKPHRHPGSDVGKKHPSPADADITRRSRGEGTTTKTNGVDVQEAPPSAVDPR